MHSPAALFTHCYKSLRCAGGAAVLRREDRQHYKLRNQLGDESAATHQVVDVHLLPVVEIDVVALVQHDGRDALAPKDEQTPAKRTNQCTPQVPGSHQRH